MNSNYDLHIVAIVEKGYLESQFKLLALSIAEFLPSLSIKLIACSPRLNKQPSSQFQTFLSEKQIDFIDKPLNIEHDFFPLCNGIYACDYVARTYNDIKSLLLVDTDTVFLNPIKKDLLSTNLVHLRPVDNKGIGSSGSNDPNNLFWDNTFQYFNIQPNNPKVSTTVSNEIIRPYYNSGFILANDSGFMMQWKQDFLQLMNSSIRTCPSSSRYKVDYGFIEQMVLSITSEKFPFKTKILPQTYNYPIPFRPLMKTRPNHPKFNELVHVHYHKWFQHPGFLDHVTDEEEKKSEQYLWLKEHLPLLPEIDGPFKC